MESTTPTAAPSKTTPKDFFLWLLAIIALYGSISSLLTLLFEYINYSFPDALAGAGDPYGSTVRFSMAALIVLVPTMLVSFKLIRTSIVEEAGKAVIWVRRWALVLTLFIATVTILIDLVTLINTFLNGEITTRFVLKVLVVLLVAVGVSLHFLADLKGYWIQHTKKAAVVAGAVGVLALVTVIAGFFIVGTPGQARDVRLDMQRVADLSSIQQQVVTLYQQTEKVPATLEELRDPLGYFTLPTDPLTHAPYRYTKTGELSFELCAEFAREGQDLAGRGSSGKDFAVSYPMPYGGIEENWQHGAGEVCFPRTIDPERYPVFPKPAR